MGTERICILKIFRHKPESGKAPGYQDFRVKATSEMTILDALDKIRLEQDTSLMYRHSCHHSSCGTCACKINGKEALACVTKLYDFEENSITVEPLEGLKLIGDLVVDMSDFKRKIPGDFSYHKKCGRVAPEQKSEAVENISRLEDCIECASCYSACPVAGGDKPFLGPAAMAAYNNELKKFPGKASELLPVIKGDNGEKLCERAIACSRVCPTKVAPAKHIAELRKNDA